MQASAGIGLVGACPKPQVLGALEGILPMHACMQHRGSWMAGRTHEGDALYLLSATPAAAVPLMLVLCRSQQEGMQDYGMYNTSAWWSP